MGKPFGPRALLAICGVFIALLAALAAVQYRWSTRVAAADAQREKEHLDSAASLFASEFNDMLEQAAVFLQNDAWAALRSSQRLAAVPKVIGELYYLDFPPHGSPKTRRLTQEGFFVASTLPQWIAISRCATLAIEQPPAVVAPVLHIFTAESHDGTAVRMLKTLRFEPERCFVARTDETYLRDVLFPQLIRQSFGETATREYDFAVVSRNAPRQVLYGSPIRADLQRTFFSIGPKPLELSKPPLAATAAPRGNATYIQRGQIIIAKGGQLTDFLGPGIWELDVAHKGVPLSVAFEQRRQRDLLLSVAVEALLIAAVVFLVIGARRMQRLADQKMQFVAGVSHELRTPVSAIAMLSRNQADGLVAGAEKIKQYGELIHQQSRRLNEMVEQTLQYAGIHSRARRQARNEVDLRTLIQETVDARREVLARKGFDVEIAISPDLPRVFGDRELLRTAFDNLLSNAEKYADGGHWIRVSASYSAREKEVQISIEDRGVGIDRAEQSEIFEPFCRGRAAVEAQIPGSGLGLSLVRSALEAHRGSVTLVSEPGRGSAFTLHLPV
jgi:two-component system, OmpR family, sensor histidine kinase SenX3